MPLRDKEVGRPRAVKNKNAFHRVTRSTQMIWAVFVWKVEQQAAHDVCARPSPNELWNTA